MNEPTTAEIREHLEWRKAYGWGNEHTGFDEITLLSIATDKLEAAELELSGKAGELAQTIEDIKQALKDDPYGCQCGWDGVKDTEATYCLHCCLTWIFRSKS